MRLILLLLIPFCFYQASGQNETVYFSDVLKLHLNKYNLKSDLELERGNLTQANYLFDSLVKHHMVGSRFHDYSFKNYRGGKVRLAKIKKPIFIITYASWCVLDRGEIAALNKLSRKYSKDVQFIVLFWDKRANVRKISHKFGAHIKVCYANEAYRNDARIVTALKHTLGFPTSYFLNANLDVVDIKRGGAQSGYKSTYLNSVNLNLSLFQERLTSFMLRKDSVKQLAATE